MRKVLSILLALALLTAPGFAALAETADAEADNSQVELTETEAADAQDQSADAEAADAPAEAPEIAGIWYGEVFGMAIELNLQDDGTYTLSIPIKGERRTGLWTPESDLVILDRDTASRVILHAEDVALYGTIDGVDLILTRDEAEPFDGITPKEDVVMADFVGQWSCAVLGVDDVFVDAAGGDESPLKLDIAGEKVVIDSGDGSEPVTAAATYANSVMTIDLGAETSCLIRPLENGMLRMEVNLGGEAGVMVYFFERYEGDDAEEAEGEESDGDDAEEAEGEETEEDEADGDDEEDAAEPEGDALPEAEDEDSARVRAVIEACVRDETGVELDDVMVDPDGENYTADISLSWLEESPGSDARVTLQKLSDDLAARVGQRCEEIDSVDIHWIVPALDGAEGSVYYMRSDDGMEEAGADWDTGFDA